MVGTTTLFFLYKYNYIVQYYMKTRSNSISAIYVQTYGVSNTNLLNICAAPKHENKCSFSILRAQK